MKFVITLLGAFFLTGCCFFNPSQCVDSESAIQALKKCAGSRIQPSDHILYFGPNNIPIGTIYEKVEDGYDASWRGTEITGDAPPSSIVEKPAYGNCSFKSKSSIDLKAAFGASIEPLPVGGDLSSDFKSAKVIDMSADQFGWETLYKGPYRDLLLKKTNIHNDIVQRDAAATIALVKVKGYRVTLQVANDAATSLKTKYKNGPLPKGLTGDIDANVGVQWTGDSTLVLVIQDETTIAGVMRSFNKGQLQSSSSAEDFFSSNVAEDGGKVKLYE